MKRNLGLETEFICFYNIAKNNSTDSEIEGKFKKYNMEALSPC